MISLTGRGTLEEALTTPAPALRAASEQPRPQARADSLRSRARVRVLPVDPRSLYCFWALEPTLTAGLIAELGERAASLCQLMLVAHSNERSSEWLAPIGAGSLYIRVVAVGQPHLVELFLTLPSGERCFLAASNVATPPPERPASQPALRAVRVVSGPRGAQLTEIPPRSAAAGSEPAVQPTPASSWALGGPGHVGSGDLLAGASDTFRR